MSDSVPKSHLQREPPYSYEGIHVLPLASCVSPLNKLIASRKRAECLHSDLVKLAYKPRPELNPDPRLIALTWKAHVKERKKQLTCRKTHANTPHVRWQTHDMSGQSKRLDGESISGTNKTWCSQLGWPQPDWTEREEQERLKRPHYAYHGSHFGWPKGQTERERDGKIKRLPPGKLIGLIHNSLPAGQSYNWTEDEGKIIKQ